MKSLKNIIMLRIYSTLSKYFAFNRNYAFIYAQKIKLHLFLLYLHCYMLSTYALNF